MAKAPDARMSPITAILVKLVLSSITVEGSASAGSELNSFSPFRKIAEGVSLDDFEQVTSNERRAAGEKEGADRPADQEAPALSLRGFNTTER